MSPLAVFLMLILRNGSIGAAALLVLFAGIEVYQHISPEGQLVMTSQDWRFLGVLAALIVMALYLVRSIAKEIENSRNK
jgi:hypothetical protein